MNKLVRNILMLVMVLVSVGIVSDNAYSQDTSDNKTALVFTLNAFSELSLDSYNGGVGFLYGLTPSLAFRGSVGYTSTGDVNSSALTGAVLNTFESQGNVSAFYGAEVGYSSDSNDNSTTSVGGLLGVEFTPWQNVGLSTEYQVVSYSKASGASDGTFSVGTGGGRFTALFYF